MTRRRRRPGSALCPPTCSRPRRRLHWPTPGRCPWSSLRAVAQADADGALAETLDITTVRDFALWPPYLAARSILDEATQASAPATDDTPGDLLPMSGRYPTERAYYSSYILADVDDPAADDRRALEDAGPLDPLPASPHRGSPARFAGRG